MIVPQTVVVVDDVVDIGVGAVVVVIVVERTSTRRVAMNHANAAIAHWQRWRWWCWCGTRWRGIVIDWQRVVRIVVDVVWIDCVVFANTGAIVIMIEVVLVEPDMPICGC